MSALFLFGAGASAHSGECYPTCPPLGPDLLADLSKLGGVASAVPPHLAVQFSDFEKGMAEFDQRYPNATVDLLREMGLYFAPFRPGSDNYYRRLFAGLAKLRYPAILATLNYEMLIEIAVTSEWGPVAYDVPATPNGSIPLLKLHGSCNFLPAGAQFIRNVHIDRTGSLSATLLEGEVHPTGNMREVIDFCRRIDSSIAPSLAIYAKGKQVLVCPGFIRAQQRDWASLAASADRIFVIGVRVVEEDTHVWDPLRLSTAPISFVDPQPGQFFDWANRAGRANVSHLARTFEEAVPLILEQLR